MDDMLSLPDPEALTVTELRQTLETEGFIMALQSGEDAVLTLSVLFSLLNDSPAGMLICFVAGLAWRHHRLSLL